jgi:hypothetical protein
MPITPCIPRIFLLLKKAPEVGGAIHDVLHPQADRAHCLVRLKREAVEKLMEERTPGTTLEQALEVFEVFASGTLADEVYILDDVSGKRIAIAPAALKAKYRKE